MNLTGLTPHTAESKVLELREQATCSAKSWLVLLKDLAVHATNG